METFVVRVWTPAEDSEERLVLHGVVEHVGSGSVQPVRGEYELLAALRAGLQAGSTGETRTREEA